MTKIELNSEFYECLSLLIEAGADFSIASDHYYMFDRKTPYYYAYKFNDQAIMKLLLEKAELATYRTNGKGQTPLHLHIMSCDEQMISVVLSHLKPSDITRSDQIHGDTPLMLACRHGYTSIVSKLLHHSTDGINAFNFHGYTALHLACLGSWVMSKNDNRFQNHIITSTSRKLVISLEIIHLLMKAGSIPTIEKMLSKASPIKMMIDAKKWEIVEALLEYQYPIPSSCLKALLEVNLPRINQLLIWRNRKSWLILSTSIEIISPSKVHFTQSSSATCQVMAIAELNRFVASFL